MLCASGSDGDSHLAPMPCDHDGRTAISRDMSLDGESPSFHHPSVSPTRRIFFCERLVVSPAAPTRRQRGCCWWACSTLQQLSLINSCHQYIQFTRCDLSTLPFIDTAKDKDIICFPTSARDSLVVRLSLSHFKLSRNDAIQSYDLRWEVDINDTVLTLTLTAMWATDRSSFRANDPLQLKHWSTGTAASCICPDLTPPFWLPDQALPTLVSILLILLSLNPETTATFPAP